MADQIRITAIDDPDGTLYTLAPEFIAKAIRRRFEDSAPVVVCPDSPDCFILNPGNFWDGPTHIRWDGENTLFFESWGGPQHFVICGPNH